MAIPRPNDPPIRNVNFTPQPNLSDDDDISTLGDGSLGADIPVDDPSVKSRKSRVSTDSVFRDAQMLNQNLGRAQQNLGMAQQKLQQGKQKAEAEKQQKAQETEKKNAEVQKRFEEQKAHNEKIQSIIEEASKSAVEASKVDMSGL